MGAGDPLQAGPPGLGGIPGHPAFAGRAVWAWRTKPHESPPPGASRPHRLGRVQRRGRSRHRREDKAVASPRLGVFLLSLSLWQLRSPPASEGGLPGRRRQGRTPVCFATLFSQARLPNPVCIWPRCCDSGAKPGCSRHSGVPSTLTGWFREGLVFLGEALPGAGER